MRNPITTQINEALRAAKLPHVATFVPALDESMDPEVEIRLCGAPTRFAVQLGDDGMISLNEYLFENGELDGVTMHVVAPRGKLRFVVAKLITLL